MSVGCAPAARCSTRPARRCASTKSFEQFVPDALAAGRVRRGTGQRRLRLDEQLRDGERAGPEAAARHLGSARTAAPRCASRAPPSPSHPYPIFDHPARQELRRLRRGPAAQGFRQRGAGRLRQHRAAEALHHGRHGTEPGQALEHERDPHPGASCWASRPARSARPRRGRSSIRCRCRIWPGAAFTPTRRTPLHARHEAAGRGVHAGRRLAAAGVLRGAAASRKSECRARGSARGAQRVGIIDVGTLGKMEISGPDAASFSSASTPAASPI